eukprot:scaffold25838_cov106-Skeletonema_dohrnii-CCMP3373.AAC.2
MCARGHLKLDLIRSLTNVAGSSERAPTSCPDMPHRKHVRAILPWIHDTCRQHYAVTVDTVQFTHHVLDGNTATTNYTIYEGYSRCGRVRSLLWAPLQCYCSSKSVVSP